MIPSLIILISGNSSTGKTLMSQKLLEKYHIPYYSIDHLKMGLYRSDRNCGFTPEDSIETISEKLWPIVMGMIMTAIENNQHLIIEGCYILPRHIAEFDEEYSKNIIPVFIGFSPQYISDHFTSSIVKHRSAIERRGLPDLHVITEYDFKKKCSDCSVKYFEIAENYEEEIQKVYDYIDSQISEE